MIPRLLNYIRNATPEPLLLSTIDATIKKNLLLSGSLIGALALALAIPSALTARAVQQQYINRYKAKAAASSK